MSRLEHAGVFAAIIAGLGAAGWLVFAWRAPDRALTLGRHTRKQQRRGSGEGGEVRWPAS